MLPSEQNMPVLAALRAALAVVVRSNLPDLTSRQLALLLTVFMAPGPHTVRGLSVALALPKPAVTRALDRLEELAFVKRRRDSADRRSVEVHRRTKGAAFLSDLAEITRAAATEPHPSTSSG
jgi:DNA-binding MarR family transcriptional regulator